MLRLSGLLGMGLVSVVMFHGDREIEDPVGLVGDGGRLG